MFSKGGIRQMGVGSCSHLSARGAPMEVHCSPVPSPARAREVARVDTRSFENAGGGCVRGSSVANHGFWWRDLMKIMAPNQDAESFLSALKSHARVWCSSLRDSAVEVARQGLLH